MQFEPDKISSYYNKSAKPSFIFYRTAIIASMVVLLAALGVNLYALQAEPRTQTQTEAANPNSQSPSLPSLPKGCNYNKSSQGYMVTCNTPMPSPTSTSIKPTQALPLLPPQCKYVASRSGTIVNCASSNGQTFTIPLPR